MITYKRPTTIAQKLTNDKRLAFTAQFTTAKTSGWANVSSNRYSQAKKVCGWNDANPGLPDRNLLNYTRIENSHETRKKTFSFFYCAPVKCTTIEGTEQIRD